MCLANNSYDYRSLFYCFVGILHLENAALRGAGGYLAQALVEAELAHNVMASLS